MIAIKKSLKNWFKDFTFKSRDIDIPVKLSTKTLAVLNKPISMAKAKAIWKRTKKLSLMQTAFNTVDEYYNVGLNPSYQEAIKILNDCSKNTEEVR